MTAGERTSTVSEAVSFDFPLQVPKPVPKPAPKPVPKPAPKLVFWDFRCRFGLRGVGTAQRSRTRALGRYLKALTLKSSFYRD